MPPGMVQVTVLPAIWFDPVFVVHCVAPKYAPPFTEMCQVYEYGDVPVDGIVPVMVSTWSESILAAEIDGVVEAVSWDDTVIVEDDGELVVSEVDAPSDT